MKDKTVLITGATGALGRVVSRSVAASGARMVLTGRRLDALQSLAAELGLDDDRVLVCSADLTKSEEVQALMGAVAPRWDGVDILLNTTGGWRGGQRLADLSEEDWDRTMDLNLRSAFLINRAVLRHMVGRGWGRIVNVASGAAERPRARQAAYNVSKAGVVALTASIAEDYRRMGVVANVVLPSIIDTPDNRAQMPEADHSRWVRPEELVQVMLFLCSEEASGLNGASIPVYGRV